MHNFSGTKISLQNLQNFWHFLICISLFRSQTRPFSNHKSVLEPQVDSHTLSLLIAKFPVNMFFKLPTFSRLASCDFFPFSFIQPHSLASWLFPLKKSGLIFPNFLRFWCQKNPHIFLIIHEKFYSWNMFRSEDLVKMWFIMTTKIKLTNRQLQKIKLLHTFKRFDQFSWKFEVEIFGVIMFPAKYEILLWKIGPCTFSITLKFDDFLEFFPSLGWAKPKHVYCCHN